MSCPRVKVREIAEQIRGVTFDKAESSKSPATGTLPVLRANNITDSGLVFEDLVYVPKRRISSKQLLQEGDVVIAASSGSLDVVGKAAMLKRPFEGGFGAFCKVLRPRGEVDPSYFAHFFLTSHYRRRISALAAGANINNLKNEHLDNLELPLPPMEEQRRIAAILDQAEELRAQRRAAIALLDQLPQAIFLEMFGDPARNPKGWPMVSLECVSQFIRNGKSIKQNKEAGGLPITRIETIANGHVNVAKCGYAGISEEDASGFLMKEGDLLFSHINSFEHVGKTAIYEGVPALLVHGMNLLCIRPNQQVVRPLYILQHLRTSAFRRDLEPFINKAVNQASVSGTNLKAVKVPVPPIETQQLFADRVEAIYCTKAAHQSALTELDALFASLQVQAFGKT